MRAGTLRHRLTLQTPVDTQSSNGQITRTYQDDAVVWGNIKPLVGREYLAAQQVNASVTTQITIRYRPGILPTMRITHRSSAQSAADDIYDVESVAEDDVSGRRHMRLMCVKREGQRW